ncbi:kinesin-like protein KIN-7I [Hermetia illucens]|uniref:kinesin-like protein KIN-7I n=1 Tax=Hermetia illucens TaxID=343691 RepID=UPI0018CC61EE|nr:kinesin-like protein KIN-7I [Hermetia illucens]
MSADNIQVAIKVRPLSKKEKENKSTSQWRIVDNSIQLIDSQSEPFYFDHIFDDTVTNEKIFHTMAKPIVAAALRGFNGTIFAYGQTSSGKTYTMLGDEENPGVMIRAGREIFNEIEKAADRAFLIRVGYIEIYNEKIFDLLDKKNQDLKIHETATGEVSVNCTESIIRSEEDMLHHLYTGNKARRIGETSMNERSSRSHAIFRIIIESREFDKPTDETAVQISHLNLVDLAGSERADQTGATGSRLKEGCHINKSLLSLSLVIKKLSENESDKYINYRDSKLTRILQASLGGNALTAIICNIKSTTVEETNSTLSFAMRAKSIKNKPHKNEILSDSAMMKRLAKEISRLQKELEVEKSKNSKIKVVQIERQIKDAELKIVHSHALSTNTNQLRRRTWCPSTSQPVIANGTCNENAVEDIKQDLSSQMFMTPLITFRDCKQQEEMLEEKFVPSSEIQFPLIDERDYTDMKTPTKKMNVIGKISLTPVNDMRTKYNMLLKEVEELNAFSALEKDTELCEAKERINKLEKEHHELLSIRDKDFENQMKLARAQQRCLELESRISELNEKVCLLETQHSAYQIEIEENQRLIKTLQMASKNVEDVEFEYEKHKENSKSREDDLVGLLAERDHQIQLLERKLIDAIESRNVIDNNLLSASEENSTAKTISKTCTEPVLITTMKPTPEIDITQLSTVEKLQDQLEDYRICLEEKEGVLIDLNMKMQEIQTRNVQLEGTISELSDQVMEYIYENEVLLKKCEEHEINEFARSLLEEIVNELPISVDKGDSGEELMNGETKDVSEKSCDYKSQNVSSPIPAAQYESRVESEAVAQIDNLNQFNSELKQKINKYEIENTDLKERLDGLAANMKRIELDNLQLVECIEGLKSSKENLEGKLKEAQLCLAEWETASAKKSQQSEEASEKIACLESEITTLKKHLGCLETEKKVLEEECNEVSQAKQELVSEGQLAKMQLDELLKQKSDWEQIISQSEEDIIKLREQVTQLQKQLEEMRFEKEATNEKLTYVEGTRCDFEEKIDNHKQKIHSLEMKNAELSESLKDFEKLKKELEEQQAFIDLTKQKLEAKDSEIARIMSQNFINSESYNLLNEANTRLKQQNEDRLTMVNELESELKLLREDKNKFVELSNSVEREKVNYEREKLAFEKKYEELVQTKEKLQDSLSEYKDSIQSLKSENEEIKTEKISLADEINALNEVNNKLSEEILTLRNGKLGFANEVEALKMDLSRAEKNIEGLKQNDTKRVAEISNLKNLNVLLEENIETLQTDKSNLEEKYEESRKENHELKSALENTKHELQCSETKINSLKQEMDKAADNLLELQQERDSLLEVKGQLENEFQRKLVEECELTVAELTNVRSQNLVLTEKLEMITGEIGLLQTLLDKANARAEEMEKLVSELNGQLESSKHSYEELERKYLELLSENKNLNVRISDYEDTVTSLERDIKRLQTEQEVIIGTHKEQFAKASAKLTKMKGELETQIQQFNRMKKENEELKQELISKEAQNQSLLAELESLKSGGKSAGATSGKENEELLKQLHEMQKMHIYKMKQYQQEIHVLKSQISEMSRKTEVNERSNKFNTGDAEKQKIIKTLLGENDELRLKNEALTVELQDSRKTTQKERKAKRYSNHDESRSLSWLDYRDTGTMTIPTDKLCNCEQLNKELIEAKNALLIKDCQINTLRMESKLHPLKDECEALKRVIEEEEAEKKEMRKELNKLRVKISELYKETKKCDQCIRRSRTIFVDQYSQTALDEQSNELNNKARAELAQLQQKYEDMKRLCRLRNNRIAELENEISKKENYASNRPVSRNINTENIAADPVLKELTLYKKKYEEAKSLVGFHEKHIQSLEAELSQVKRHIGITGINKKN